MSLSDLWAYKVPLVPLAIGLLVIFVPTWIRRLFNLWYGPVYFTVMPLEYLNADLSKYYVDDFFMADPDLLSPGAERRLANRIRIQGVKFLFAATVVSPIISALVITFFIRGNDIYAVIACAFLFKIKSMAVSVRDFKEHAVANAKTIASLLGIYVVYLGVYYQAFIRTYQWALPFVDTGNYWGLAVALGDLIFWDLALLTMIMAICTAPLIEGILNKDVRQANVEAIRQARAEGYSEE